MSFRKGVLRYFLCLSFLMISTSSIAAEYGVSSSISFVDEYGGDTDGGDYPENPGCFRVEDNDSTCSSTEPRILLKDFCNVNGHLVEYDGDATCIIDPSFIKNSPLNCETYCQNKYGRGGDCLLSGEGIYECALEQAAFCGCELPSPSPDPAQNLN